ncbi:MAG TPA: NAD(P)/FAD-dependent oxidoreductase [Solirubrobacteraceae bacterium]|nr:NAD(P)/FAD-dependent oxidoreductase [Solirubrobacteraceae bacterium]
MSADANASGNGGGAQRVGDSSKRPSVAIIGGGFSGVGAAVLLVRAGYPDVTIFERGERLGGVWAHNTYPGAACDVPSHLYEFSFEPNPRWSRRYAPQAEIQQYIEAVARRHGVLEHARTGTEVTRAEWDEEPAKWQLQTSAGPFEADILLTACGQLSIPKAPAIEGLDGFAGPVFHTAEWNHDVDLAGRRVAVIGTGCSAIQAVPAIQPLAGQIDVYQRSPGWTMPKMDFEYSERAKRLFERLPVLRRLDRLATFLFMDIGAAAMTSQRWLLAPFRAAGRRQIETAINDRDLRAKVTPTDEIGCKRIMLTDAWYPTLEQPNVELITERIEQITPTGIRSEDGTERPTDVIVLATGFESHAFVAPMEVIGAGGRTLAEEWEPVARAYLGLSVPGFPNMFLLYGPNTNGGTGSVIYVTEAGIAHVVAALDALRLTNANRIEVRRERTDAFNRELRTALAGTVWHTGCTSWYLDENGNDPNQWPWTWSTYRRRTQRLEPGAYDTAHTLDRALNA